MLRYALALGALMVALPATAQYGRGEWLAFNPPPGFVKGHSQVAGNQSIEEWVPRGESVHRWSRMVTIQRLQPGAGVTAAQFLRVWGNRMQSSCRGSRLAILRSVPNTGSIGGIRWDCPRMSSTGRPESVFAKAMRGSTGLYLMQVALRRTPSAADTRWAEGGLSGMTLCSPRATAAACRKRPL